MRGVESEDEVVIHAVSSRRDQDIVCKDIAYNFIMTSHEHSPGRMIRATIIMERGHP